MPKRARNKFVKRGEQIDILIEDYAFGGKGIGRIRNEEGELLTSGTYIVWVSRQSEQASETILKKAVSIQTN
mgnify:CR=1 FL=1